MWLDKKSMKRTSRLEAALGTRNYKDIRDDESHTWLDVSKSRVEVKDSGPWRSGKADWLEFARTQDLQRFKPLEEFGNPWPM